MQERVIWDLTTAVILWGVWKELNNGIFQQPDQIIRTNFSYLLGIFFLLGASTIRYFLGVDRASGGTTGGVCGL